MSVAVTRIVNACALLDIDGDHVLTDPCFTPPLGVRFNEPVGLRVDDLPPLAAIVVGHRVPDHWQPRALRRYEHRRDTPMFVPTRSMARAARRLGFERAEMLAWGDHRTTGRLGISCLPGERVIGMRTNTYVITSTTASVLVATEGRAVVPDQPVDVAVLPIDGTRLLSRPLVMDAATAAATAERLGASLVPIHHSQRPRPPILRCPSGIHDLPTGVHPLEVGVRTTVYPAIAAPAGGVAPHGRG